MAYPCDPSSCKAETGRSEVQGQPQVHSEFNSPSLSQEKEKKNEANSNTLKTKTL